jgi:hypothetical protein
LHRRCHDLRADAVAGKHGDMEAVIGAHAMLSCTCVGGHFVEGDCTLACCQETNTSRCRGLLPTWPISLPSGG